MSLKLSNIRWGWVALGTVLAVIAYVALQILVNVGYGVVLGFQLRGSPPREVLNEAFTSVPFLILYVFETAAGALVGGRLAGKRGEGAPQLNGLVVGIGMAIVLLVLGAIQNALSPWIAPYCAMAIVGGWLGGWFAIRQKR